MMTVRQSSLHNFIQHLFIQSVPWPTFNYHFRIRRTSRGFGNDLRGTLRLPSGCIQNLRANIQSVPAKEPGMSCDRSLLPSSIASLMSTFVVKRRSDPDAASLMRKFAQSKGLRT